MAIRFMKNVPATTFPLMGIALYAYLRTVLGLTVIDTVGTWNTTSYGADGSTVVGTPNTFYVTTPGTFVSGHIGFRLAVRDPLNPRNSGVFIITAVAVDGLSCTLAAPVGTFVSTATGLRWSLHSNVALPAVNDRFVVGRAGATPTSWHLQVQVTSTNVTLRIGPRGGYVTASHAFTGLTLTDIVLGPEGVDTPTLQFAAGDEVAGWVTFWIRTAATTYAIVHLGEYTPIHYTGVPGTPQDDIYVGAFGQTALGVDSCEADATITTSVAANCHMVDYDKATVVHGRFSCFSIQGATTDILANSAYALNPRTGQSDDFSIVFGVPAAASIKQVRGILKGMRRVNSTLSALTLLSGGTVLSLRRGIAVPWDTTTPI